MIYNNFLPLIEDIKRLYVTYRRMGQSRAEAVETLLDEYSWELTDTDERLAVLLGISFALCKKNELYEEIAAETRDELQRVRQAVDLNDKEERYLSNAEQQLLSPESYGPEAKYRKKVIYVPDWKNGDTFARQLTYPDAEGLGIMNWYIILHKVGEHVDDLQEHRQLMTVSLCPPDKLPRNSDELQQLGFLPMMRFGNRFEYLAQITIKSKRVLDGYGLSFIGHFPDVDFPSTVMDENPLVAMPLFGILRKDDLWPSYEDVICRKYRAHKTGK